jgi:protein-S-isoprenylcysteine O-methyltransferase Ste14
MALAELALYGVGLAMGVVARMVMQKRRTGDTGFRGVRAVRGTHRWVNGLLATAVVAGVSAPAAALAGLRPVDALEVTVLHGFGVALAIIGVAAVFAAQVSMGDSWRVGLDEAEDTRLVTTGAFGLVRNPIYAAVFVTMAGFVLMVPNVLSLGSLATFVVAFEWLVRKVEEPYLAQLHGAAYEQYAATVGRFFPMVGRWGPARG